MVINIAIELMSRLPEWEKQERLKFASEILQCIEMNGMLPPPEYHEQDREAKVACNTAKQYMTWDEE